MEAYRHILVALDFGADHKQIVDRAVQIAKAEAA